MKSSPLTGVCRSLRNHMSPCCYIITIAFVLASCEHAGKSGIDWQYTADLDGDGRAEIVVGTEMGQVQRIDAEKKRLFITDVEEYVTALAARPRAPGHEVWVGTVNGKLFALDAKGTVLRRGRMPGLVDHLVVSREGAVLATTSGGRMALFRE